jgi:hypothetical protein
MVGNSVAVGAGSEVVAVVGAGAVMVGDRGWT